MLQPLSSLVIESALGPVTTTLGAEGAAACRLVAQQGHRFAGGAERAVPSSGDRALAAWASTHGVFGSLTHGWSNRPSLNFSVRSPARLLIDPPHRNRARLHVLEDGGLPLIGVGHVHSHVDTGVHGLGDRLSRVGGDVVGRLQRLHVLVIADHDALEVHLVPEDVGQQIVRPGRRNAVDGTGVDHHRACSRINGSGVRRKDHALQVVQRQQGLVAVVAVDRLRVASEVLDSRGDTERAGRTRRLKAVDVGGAHGGGQQGSSAQVSYVRPHLLSRARSCTGANVNPSRWPAVRSPWRRRRLRPPTDPRWRPSRSTAGTTAPARGDQPWTASTPKINGMCSREFWIAYFWIMLYSLAQS